jgi:hypothetical protein
MNLMSAIRCTLLFLTLVDATNGRLRGRGRPLSSSGYLRGHGRPLSSSGITFPPAPPESIAPGEPNPGTPLEHENTPAPPESIAPGEPNPGTPLEHEGTLPVNPIEIDVDCQPLPKADEARDQCILSFAPVVCNGVCKFNNGCLAGQAGFAESDCELLEEPPDTGMGPLPSTIAIGELYPAPPIPIGEAVEEPATGMGPSTIAIGEPYPVPQILIGQPNDTEEAIVVEVPGMIPIGKPLEEPDTGMGPSTIVIGEPYPVPPIPIGDDGIGLCSLAFVPVVCDDLYKFENLCLANAAGYAEEKCTLNPVDVSVSQTNDTEETILVEGPGRAIPGETAVSIISDTEEASSAYPNTPPGKPSVSILTVTEEATSGNMNGSWCPETGSDVVCNERFDPVLCGPELCKYDNLCFGIGADFSETDCGSARYGIQP